MEVFVNIKQPVLTVKIEDAPALGVNIERPELAVVLQSSPEVVVNIKQPVLSVNMGCACSGGTTAPSAGTSFDFVAGEDIAARSLICVGSDGLLYNADNTDPAKAAIGAVQTAIASGDTGTAYLGSAIITGFTGLTPGPYFLSAAGGIDTTVTDTAGGIIQHIGTALSATVLAVFPHLHIYNPPN